jgi:periplasmic copper chaperone A
MCPGRVPAAAAVALAAIAVLATGCGNTQPAASSQPASMGANAQVGQVLLRDVQVTTGTTDLGRDATVRLTLVNQAGTPDALTAVGSDVAGRAEMLADSACSRSTVRLAVPAGPSAQYLIRLSDLRIGLVRGGNVPITFTFANAGTITVPTPVGSDTALPAGCAG